MAKRTYDEEIDRSVDWGGDESTNNLPVSGRRVQEFITKELFKRAAAYYFDSQEMELLGFASDEEKAEYLDTKDETLIINRTPFSFTGTVRHLKVSNNGSGNSLYFTTSQTEAIISTSFLSQEKGLTDTEWRSVEEDFVVSVYVDRGATGNYQSIRSEVLVLNGNNFEVNVRDYLITGNNRVRVTAVGTQTGETGSLIITANLTTMYLQASDFAWQRPFVEGNSYSLGGMNIGGNLPKTLIVTVRGEGGYYKRYDQSIGTTTYINTPYYFNDMEFPTQGTGVYSVELWVQAEGIESDHLKYDIMCVASQDAMSAQLIAISDVNESVENYADNSLLKYVCYNMGAATADVDVTVTSLINNKLTTVYSNTLENVTTGEQHEIIIPLELETEESGLKLTTTVSVGECVKQAVATIDNSRSYPAATGATFYINPALRNNSDNNREQIINTANSSETPINGVEWTNMTWVGDGWTTDENGRKCLYIPAGSRCIVPLKLLSVNMSKSVELVFRTDNVSDYSQPVATIYENNGTSQSYWVGFKAFPTKAILHSNALHSNDLQQSYDYCEGELVDLIFSIAKPYRNNSYGNIAFIYCNGTKKCSFPFTNTDSFLNDGYLVLGSDYADLSIYKIRGYDRALEGQDACRNFVNSLPTSLEKTAAQNSIDEVVDDSFNIDYDKIYGKKNTMVVEMLNGDSLPHYGLSKSYTARANVDFNFIKEYEYNDETIPTWGFSLNNVEFSGQGSTSMNYWVWNLRMRPDKTKNPGCTIVYADGRENTDNKHVIFDPTSDRPTVGRITAKKNYASSPQSHKMGSTASFNALHDYIFGESEDHACVAVYQEPAYGFQKTLIEGTSQYEYKFIGLYTVGPDKGDKNTFGYNGSEVMALEGLNHNIMGVGYDYPWSEMEYVLADESICVKKANNEYDKAIEVSQAGSAESEDDIKAKIETEFRPAYELLYNDSTMIMGVSMSLAQINADVNAWRQMCDTDGHSYQRYEFWTDGEYKLFYFNVRTEQYEYNGINLLTQLGISTSELSGKTISEKNEIFKKARRSHFKANAANYWDVQDNLFCLCFLFIIGASDNFKKNSYPQKLKLLASGGRWGQRQDDLDTIFATDNQGLNSKNYSIEMFDWSDEQKTAYVFKGEDSRWVRLFVETFTDEFMNMGRSILGAMYALGSGDDTFTRLKNFFNRYYFDKAQNYFSKSAYNNDAELAYEEAYLPYKNGGYSVDVSPLAQSKGDAVEAEREWLEKRILYVCSYFKYGMFGSSSDASCGRITFRTQTQQSFTLTPAIDLYPAIAYGESSSKQSSPNKIPAGQSVTLNNVGGSNTNVYIMASDWLSDIGDLSKLAVDASSDPAIAVSGKKLQCLKVGDSVAGNVTSNLAELRIGSCPSMVELDARNLSSLKGTVDLSDCGRLRRAWFGGTSVAEVKTKPGARIQTLELPSTVIALELRGLKSLTDFDYSHLNSISYLYLDDMPSSMAFPILKQLYNSDNSQLRDIRIVGFEYTGDGANATMLANIANNIDKNGQPHAYDGIDASGIVDPTMLPVIEGTLNVTEAMYRNDEEAIKTYYPRLTVNVTGGYYIWFEDPEVRSAMLSLYGDATGVKESRLASITAITSQSGWPIRDSSAFTTFDEFKYFSGLTSIGRYEDNTSTSGTFYNAMLLSSIKLPESLRNIYAYSFASCSSLASITLPASVTQIGSFAFDGCSSLSSITVKCGPATFGNFAFRNCNNLAEVHISDLAAWCGIAFYNYTSNPLCYAHKLYLNGKLVTDLVVPDSITRISSYAFYNCDHLSTVTLPESVTSVGDYAFYNCAELKGFYGKFASDDNKCLIVDGDLKICAFKGLTEYTIPSEAISISQSAFQGCETLTSVVIPDSVTTLSNNVFAYCTALTSVTIGKSVTSIGNSVFYGCDSFSAVYISDLAAWCNIDFKNYNYNPLNQAHNLYINGTLATSLIIPDSITSIKQYSFHGCYSLVSVTIPDSVTVIGTKAFANCKNLSSVSFADSLVEIQEYAFSFCNNLTTLDLPNSLTTINDNAFNNCTSLAAITIPNSVTALGDGAFISCVKATSITLPTSITSISDWCFYNCQSITSIEIPDTVTTIGDTAFGWCTALTSVTIPSSVTTIKSSAFSSCARISAVYISDLEAWCNIDFSSGMPGSKGLYLNDALIEKLMIPATVTSIKSYTFNQISSITSVMVPNSVTSIGYRAFYSCENLTAVSISSSVTSIGQEAFRLCTNLTTINLPDPITTIENAVFYNCSKLQSITIPSAVVSIGNSAFYQCYKLQSITIPNAVTSIGNLAFAACWGLESVIIGSAVVSIGTDAFYWCDKLTTISIPGSVKSIGSRAFGDCTKLKEVICNATTPPQLGSNDVFSNTNVSLVIYVPDASVDSYKNAANWSEYASKIKGVSELSS